MADTKSERDSNKREVLQRIFHLVEQEDLRNLLSCAKVSRLWRGVCMPIIYRRFEFRIESPPAKNDVVLKYFSALRENFAMMRMVEIHVHPRRTYTTKEECTDLSHYLLEILSIVSQSLKLETAVINTSVFTPGACSDGLWPRLGHANEALINLVAAVLEKKPPELEIWLGDRERRHDANIAVASCDVFNRILDMVRGKMTTLWIVGPLERIVAWLDGNKQLRKLFYTRFPLQADPARQLETEFWKIVGGLELHALQVESLNWPGITYFHSGLRKLVLTCLDDTVAATIAILPALEHLRVLSLRLQNREPSKTDATIANHEIACRGHLQWMWWTGSNAPLRAAAVVSEECELEQLFTPRNVTDDDLLAISKSKSASTLRNFWMQYNVDVTKVGFDSLVHLKALRHLQIQIRFVEYLEQASMRSYQQNGLNKLTIVFDGKKDEDARRLEFRTVLERGGGSSEYVERMCQLSASTLQTGVDHNELIFKEVVKLDLV